MRMFGRAKKQTASRGVVTEQAESAEPEKEYRPKQIIATNIPVDPLICSLEPACKTDTVRFYLYSLISDDKTRLPKQEPFPVYNGRQLYNLHDLHSVDILLGHACVPYSDGKFTAWRADLSPDEEVGGAFLCEHNSVDATMTFHPVFFRILANRKGRLYVSGIDDCFWPRPLALVRVEAPQSWHDAVVHGALARRDPTMERVWVPEFVEV